jgi:hypothetical protein
LLTTLRHHTPTRPCCPHLGKAPVLPVQHSIDFHETRHPKWHFPACCGGGAPCLADRLTAPMPYPPPCLAVLVSPGCLPAATCSAGPPPRTSAPSTCRGLPPTHAARCGPLPLFPGRTYCPTLSCLAGAGRGRAQGASLPRLAALPAPPAHPCMQHTSRLFARDRLPFCCNLTRTLHSA